MITSAGLLGDVLLGQVHVHFRRVDGHGSGDYRAHWLAGVGVKKVGVEVRLQAHFLNQKTVGGAVVQVAGVARHFVLPIIQYIRSAAFDCLV